jgi:microcin C transport system substrate-binding protein
LFSIKKLSLLSILITFPFLLVISCKKGEKNAQPEKASNVQEIPWDGDPSTIPPALSKVNPVASPNAVRGGMFRVYSHQYPKSLNYYLEQHHDN